MRRKTIILTAVLMSLSLCACELPVSVSFDNLIREVDTTPITFETLKEPVPVSEVKSTLTEKSYAVAPSTADKSFIYDESNVELLGFYESQKEIEVAKEAEAKKKQTDKKSKGSAGSGNASKGGSDNSSQGGSGNSSQGNDYSYEEPAKSYTPPSVSGYAEQVVALVNSERANAGVGSVSSTSALNQAAQKRAEEIVSSFAHSRPDGRSCFTVFEEYGISYGAAGENIAAGQWSPENVMNSWMNSPGHRSNILDSSFAHIGVGVVYIEGSDYGYYWVQLFTD